VAKTSKSKAVEKHWTQELDQEEVREALLESTVDAYGDHEQHTALLTMIGDELEFPFKARVLGETVDVIEMEWPDGDELGLDLICERNGAKHRIEARSVELLEPFPDGHLILAAYLDWKRRL
jgi:hypothetical protein